MIIGAQLYTLREYCKTPDGLYKALEKVARMGYRAVQLSGVCAYDAEWMRGVLRELDLVAPVTHTDPKRLQSELDAVIAEHKTIGAGYIGIGSAPGVFDKTKNCLEAFDTLMAWLPAVAERIAAAGLRFVYHNHAREFAKNARGENFFDRLCRELPPAQCGLLLDTYWIQAGGADPAAFLEKYDGRIPCIHFKDMSYDPVEHDVHMAAIGEGNLNWARIFDAVRSCDVEYAFVEQDRTYGEDPFDCLARSLAFCRANGFTD